MKNKFWIIVLVLLASDCTLRDDGAKKNDQPGRSLVYDYSDFLNTKEEDSLNRILSAINEEKQIRLVYCSVDNYENEEIEVLAKKYFVTLCSSQEEARNCGLILLSRGTRGARISLGSDINKRITDPIATGILNKKMIPLFQKDLFFEGLKAGFEEISFILENKKSIAR